MSPAPELKPKSAREADLARSVKGLLRTFGIPFYVNVQGPHWGLVRGRPDMEAIKDGITYYLELKRFKKGKMSQAQEVERRRIEGAGAPYVVVRTLEDVIEALSLPVLIS